MSTNRLEDMTTPTLISLAKRHGVVDSAEPEGPQYRVKIGAANFLLSGDGTREFLIRLLRDRYPDAE